MSSPMTTPLLAKTFVRADHIRSLKVRPAPAAGWEAFEHEDNHLIQQQHYADWHRVEQALTRFARAIEELREEGWREA